MKWQKGIRDFRGLELCEPCWNGVHFISDSETKKQINNCNHGDCECLCQKMQQNHYDDLATARATNKRNKQAQIDGVEVWPMEQIGPAKSRDEG